MANRLAKKLLRLKELEHALLEAYPLGKTKSELARLINISRSEIPEYLADLGEIGVLVFEPEDGRYTIDPATHKINLRLNQNEILMVFLAIRLLTTRSDKRNPHAARALRELASAFGKTAPFIVQHFRQAAHVLESAQRRDDPLFLRWVERLGQAWAKRLAVRLDYESDEGKFTTHTFAPYFIEPYALGYTMHVIGFSLELKKQLTLKVERIRGVELTNGTYAIPEDFDPTETLKDAWGIWRTEYAPETVRLRFARAIAYRVHETQWHPNQNIEAAANGDLVWWAEISQPREMLPWIRGWGADCEVLAPAWLRAELIQESRRLSELYQPESAPKPEPYHLLWAKIDRNKHPQKIHGLLYHLLDVGYCALALWETTLPAPLKWQVAEWLGLSEAEAGRYCAFWAALHDLGKASPAFQWHTSLAEKQRNAIKAKLEQAGFQFPQQLPNSEAPHATITTWVLRNENLLPGFDKTLVEKSAQAIGGHHGAWPLSDKLNNLSSENSGQKWDVWRNTRAKLVEELLTVFQPPTIEKFELETEPQNAFFTVLSGLVSVADWLGSDNDRIFGYEDAPRTTPDYAEQAARNARRALEHHQWRALPEPRPALDFATLFPGKKPHEAQIQAIQATTLLAPPALVILEAPMGSGKTESALSMYAHWAHTADLRGLYVAMPTMATSNQMHTRVSEFLQRVYGTEIEPMLIHSRAALKDTLLDEGNRVDEDRAAAMAWFLPRKQSLLFPFGVGTVDQALMSVLQTNHFFVRLLGLSHKVIIFDEVHAYDTYMNTLFKRLLEWLRQVGASVIILSATLPNKTRRELAEAFGAPADSLPPQIYPRLTWAAQGQTGSVALPAPTEPRRLQLEWMGREPQSIIDRLRTELVEGGCAAVICNTVKRAQEIYQLLKLINNVEQWVTEDSLILFHARFPFKWRQEREEKVKALFGPPEKSPNRPQKAIVIATQVIEQSLDLDFDVMISDFAPTDLLLQRAGRLHRHTRNNRPPLPDRLWITKPEEVKDNVPQFDRADKFIYEHYVLLRSWLTMQNYGEAITLPDDLTEAIEQTYDETREFAEATEEMKAALKEAFSKQKEKQREKRHKAESRLIAEAGDNDLLLNANEKLEDEDPQVAEAFQALTRSDGPGISLVCIHRTNNGDALDPQDSSTISTRFFQPDKDTALHLALHTVTVQNYHVIQHFSANEHLPEAWKKIAALRYSRMAIFNKDGACVMEGQPYTLQLTRELGLEIISNDQVAFTEDY